MKKVKIIAASLLVLGAMVFAGCDKTNTDNGPSTADREKFLGAWQGTSSGTVLGTHNFNMTITASNSAADQILMDNFDGYGSGVRIIAVVSGNNFTIPGAPLNIIGSDTIAGSGSCNSSGNTLSFTFTVKDGQATDYRSGSAHR